MLSINSKTIEGQKFFKNGDTAIEYTCVGYGQNPSSGAMFIVGSSWDQQNNRSRIDTFLFKEVAFVGQLPTPT